MKKHLKYVDGTSDKFWQIEVSGTQYTVTYGKNGTTGTSQTKVFNDDAECLKTAEKLLADKIKKGYSEDGDINILGTPKVVPAKKTNTDEILAAYDTIIKYKDFGRLLPFLKENSKGNIEVLKKQVKKNKRFWMTFTDLKDEPQYLTDKKYTWGTRGDKDHTKIITLSAIALFNKSDIASWDEVVGFLKNAEEPLILELLKWAKPNWINDFLLDKIKKQDWVWYDYLSLRFLEQHLLIEFNPELYALCIANYRSWTGKVKIREFIKYVTTDDIAYKRDIPELFNYETGLHNNTFRDENNMLNNEDHITWAIIFNTLLDQNKLDRSFFIENCILIQTKDWNNNLKSFFRKMLGSINPSSNELIPYQENIFAALHNAFPAITNYAVDLIKKIYDNPGFNANSFLEWLEPLMMRSDCKTAIKSVIPLLEKLNKMKPELNTTITFLLADVYVIPDLSLQERVTKVILKTGNDNDVALAEKLSGYSALMQGNVKAGLDKFLKEYGDAEETETVTYHYAPTKENVLLEEVTLPQNWNDILYLFGSFIASEEVIDSEVLLNTYITQRYLFPADYSAQLQPYAKQLENKYFNSRHKAYISVFLQQKIHDIHYTFHIKDNKHDKIKTLLLIKHVMHTVQKKIDNKSALPLLSLPTHKPAWVAPKVLMERLIAYQQTEETVNALDLSIAISRMPRENTNEAIALLPQLNGEMKDLMAFCLGVTKNIGFAPSSKSFFNKLLSKLGAPANPTSIGLWAVAARTFYPEETFTQFKGTFLQEAPFVIAPFRPQIQFKERWSEYTNYTTKEKERSESWYELGFDAPNYKNIPDYLLYSQDAGGNKRSYEYMLGTEENVYYFNSLMPQNNDALSCLLLQSTCSLATGANHELKGFLNVVNQPGFMFSDMSILVFACCFFQEKKDIRMLASEVLINLIERKKIDAELFSKKGAYLASNKYGAFARLADSLATIKDVSPLHNSALLQILDGIFKHLDVTDKLPVNFKRVIENYVDVLYKTNTRPSADSVAFFEKYKENASLKTLIKQILN